MKSPGAATKPAQIAAVGGVVRDAPSATHAPGRATCAWFPGFPCMSINPPIAVARVVVGEPRDPGDSFVGGRPVVLTLYRSPDGDGTYSLVMHRRATGGR
jgi:hypothetical protein